MPSAFDGIDRKLERVDENIRNLDNEISLFFQESKYPVLPDVNDKLIFEAIQYHRDRGVPLRFSVLVGEIIHHLRSCLDHIVWEFSSEDYRREHFSRIEFPVCTNEPVDKNAITRYEGKIKGIADGAVRDLIRDLQPYKAPDPVESPILIIHKMDVFDKHRELILVAGNVTLSVPSELADRVAAYDNEDPGNMPIDLAMELRAHKASLQISFRNFGRRKIEPVVTGLAQLSNYIRRVAANFEALA